MSHLITCVASDFSPLFNKVENYQAGIGQHIYASGGGNRVDPSDWALGTGASLYPIDSLVPEGRALRGAALSQCLCGTICLPEFRRAGAPRANGVSG